MESISKAAQYRSYYEVAKKIKNPEARLAYYDALDAYRFDGIEPESLPLEADIAFTAIKANIDADLGRKHAGAPSGNQNATKQATDLTKDKSENNPKTIQNQSEKQLKTIENNPQTIENQSEKSIDLKKTNNVDVNEDVNVDVNEDVDGNTHTVSASEPFNFGQMQVDCFHLIQNHNESAPKERKVPCSNSVLAFSMKETRELLDTIGTKEPPEIIVAALQNFIKVAKSDTWQKTFTWRSFCKNYRNFTPEFFTLSKYLNTEPETEDSTQKPEYKFYMQMRSEPRFHVETFQLHITEWKTRGRPEGEDYFKLQNEWEASKC